MKIVRNNVFETNSSSTHVLAIIKENNYNLPQSITFRMDDFGWDYNVYYDMQSKADYLFTVIEYADKEKELEWLNKLRDILTKHNIKCEFKVNDDGYVDHGTAAFYFVEQLLADEDKLFRFLFDDRSYISTGNDNELGFYVVGVGTPDDYYDDDYNCSEWYNKVKEQEEKFEFYWKGN